MSREQNTAIAYAVVAKDYDDSAMAVEMDSPFAQVSDEYQHIPEARNLTWMDTYFEDDDDVVAVFDLDYQNMENYYATLGWIAYGTTLLFPTIFWVGCILGVPCFLGSNVEWSVRSQHVAITRDGIRFVRERRPTCWGMPCTDAGKSSRTIPFDQITDCDIVEPAGNTCLCVVNTLHEVHVDTASSPKNSNQQHEITISGLQNPQAFKKLVWAMKRAAPAQRSVLDRGFGAGSSASEDVASLLRDIRDELRQHNDVLQNIRDGQ